MTRTSERTAETFGSVEIDRSLRRTLMERLSAAHAERPFAADDPRATVRRVGSHLADLGLEAVRIRGTVTLGGIEVDHVWLAVHLDADRRWVLDASYPLGDPTFVSLLGGYVAGLATSGDLAAAAADLGVEQRVVALIPPPATYRGSAVWAARQN